MNVITCVGIVSMADTRHAFNLKYQCYIGYEMCPNFFASKTKLGNNRIGFFFFCLIMLLVPANMFASDFNPCNIFRPRKQKKLLVIIVTLF